MTDKVLITPPIYVGFDDNGQIQVIGPEKPSDINFFETTFKEVERLLTLQEDPLDYIVKYDVKEKKHILVPITGESSLETTLKEIVESDTPFYAVKLFINTESNCAELKVEDVIAQKLKEVKVHITKKSNPNILYKTLDIKCNSTISDDIFSDVSNISFYSSISLDKIFYEINNETHS